jgi:hypothetical protein
MKVYLHFEEGHASGLPEYTLILTLASDAPDTFRDLLDVRHRRLQFFSFI